MNTSFPNFLEYNNSHVSIINKYLSKVKKKSLHNKQKSIDKNYITNYNVCIANKKGESNENE